MKKLVRKIWTWLCRHCWHIERFRIHSLEEAGCGPFAPEPLKILAHETCCRCGTKRRSRLATETDVLLRGKFREGFKQ